ncbi:hypothetical protein EON67_07585 [archaeon]|nr:MAG: hypothetical protein EON67_07585 [archaeon]
MRPCARARRAAGLGCAARHELDQRLCELGKPRRASLAAKFQQLVRLSCSTEYVSLPCRCPFCPIVRAMCLHANLRRRGMCARTRARNAGQSTSTFAAQVSQFLYDVNIASACCQLYNFCGAQYSSDVKFLWGVPKNSSTAVQLHTAAGVVHLTPSPFAAAADSDGIDDGGCDMSFGFMSHDAVASAIAAQGEDMSSRVHLHSAGVASMPTEVHRSLAAGLSARLPHAVATVDLSSAGGAVPGSSVWATGLVRQINTLELIPCHVQTSRLRSTLGPLRNQSDFIGAMQHVQAAVKNLQTGMPQVDLAKFGITSTSPLENGLNGTFVYGYVGDNEHTTWLSSAPGGAAFPYSLTFVYYEQYNFIRGVAVSSRDRSSQ